MEIGFTVVMVFAVVISLIITGIDINAPDDLQQADIEIWRREYIEEFESKLRYFKNRIFVRMVEVVVIWHTILSQYFASLKK